MGIIEIVLVALGLAMDAFAVAICKGMAIKKFDYKKPLIISLYFGIFQAFMPLIGFYFGTSFSQILKNIDHWIAFFLLGIIGVNMILEALRKDGENKNEKTDVKTMLLLAIATSIDAFVVGITCAFLETNIFLTVALIGIITFVLSFIGVIIGGKFANGFKHNAEILGGVILIIIGLKILLEHLEIL